MQILHFPAQLNPDFSEGARSHLVLIREDFHWDFCKKCEADADVDGNSGKTADQEEVSPGVTGLVYGGGDLSPGEALTGNDSFK